MKKQILLCLIACCTAIFFNACKDDDNSTIVNAGSFSSVTIDGKAVSNNASSTESSSTFTLSWTASKGSANLKSIKVELDTIALADNASVVWDGISAGSQATTAQTATWTNTITLAAISGTYKLTLTDVNGNTAEYTFMLSASCLITQTYTVNGVSFKMIGIEGGAFNMGAQSTDDSGTNYDSDAETDESPVHTVLLSTYCIGETEVTQALWYAVMGYKPTTLVSEQWSSAYGLGDNYPAYYVSYTDITSFITTLNSLTGKTFRLPTEAEWEYAARGGNQSLGYKYAGSNTIDDFWHYYNGSHSAQIVKGKTANELGLYDMSGNVCEWCSDWSGSYSSITQTNPTGPATGSIYIVRGGSYGDIPSRCRVSKRQDAGARDLYIGFRLVLYIPA
jgi:formylglycine-generating enzyme required for sulfatase activity